MIFEDKPITLKDSRTTILKSPCVEDAEKLLNYIKKSCGETEYLARYPEEWNTTVDQEEAWVNRLRSSPDTLGITCYVDGEVAGNCGISFRGGMKTSHRATIAIAILKDYWNLGIGSAMFEELVSAAQNRGTEIMEQEFIECNDRARHLCEKFGFRVSPEEAYALDLKVNASGMTKQDYCTKKVLDEEITVHPNIRVQTYICRYLTELTEQLKRLESIEKNNDVLENIKYLLELIDKMGEN